MEESAYFPFIQKKESMRLITNYWPSAIMSCHVLLFTLTSISANPNTFSTHSHALRVTLSHILCISPCRTTKVHRPLTSNSYSFLNSINFKKFSFTAVLAPVVTKWRSLTTIAFYLTFPISSFYRGFRLRYFDRVGLQLLPTDLAY